MTNRVSLGQVVITPGALEALRLADVHSALRRHASADWGNVCVEDSQANDQALRVGTRMLSSFRDALGKVFWIITDADRSATTVLTRS